MAIEVSGRAAEASVTQMTCTGEAVRTTGPLDIVVVPFAARTAWARYRCRRGRGQPVPMVGSTVVAGTVARPWLRNGEVTETVSATVDPSQPGQDGPSSADGITIDGLQKYFGALCALDQIHLSVPWGGVVALLGPNGAGKSTLLRILGTTVLPDRGRVEVAGYDVVSQPVLARRSVGLVLGDERSWYWRLSGRDNLEFFAALHGLRRMTAQARADELLASVGLAEAADRRFDRYSSGMRARLSLARALLCEPPVLLFDEPTRTLDPLAAASFRQEVRAQAGAGRAVLFATHDLHEAAALADQVVVLVKGRVRAVSDDEADAGQLERILVDAAASVGSQ